MRTTKLVLVTTAVLMTTVLFTVPCWSADAKYPTKPIHMWVGFAAGGPTDSCARAVSSIAEKMLGQPIVVNVFAISSASGVPMGTVFRGIFPFFICMLVLLVLLVLFPQMALFLPRMFF